jgi:hypothetical protein
MKKLKNRIAISCKKCHREGFVTAICKIHEKVLCKCGACGSKFESNSAIAKMMLETKNTPVPMQTEPKILSELRPKDFTCEPWDSVLRNKESEIIARNIMKILARTGNTFRPITWEEYVIKRKEDTTECTDSESTFYQVVVYCTCAEQAIKFSPDWAKMQK